MDDFFIGWQDNPSSATKKFNQRIWIGFFALLLITASILAWRQGPFAGSSFHFGEQTTLQGVYQAFPVPSLLLLPEDSTSLEGQRILLVGPGKSGVDALVRHWENAREESLDQHWVRFRGTRIHYDGIHLFELSDGLEALLEVSGIHSTIPALEEGPERILLGEILDPKCYFGVMRPGAGKPHKSCAARCIAGGIPAVFKAPEQLAKRDYYLILGADGTSANEQLSAFAGEPVALCGQEYVYGDWKLFYLDTDQPIRRLGPPGTPVPQMCGN